MIIYINAKCKGKNSKRNNPELLVNNAVSKFVQNFSQLPYRHFEDGYKGRKRLENVTFGVCRFNPNNRFLHNHKS